MEGQEVKAAPRIIAGCPWCGNGTALSVQGDGVGGVSLACTECGCKGPTTSIGTDFEEADATALKLWSTRSAIEQEVLKSVSSSVAMALLMEGGGKLGPSSHVSIKYSDLTRIMQAAAPTWRVSL
jgi:hypothetical protein